jgi:hypothetical protein
MRESFEKHIKEMNKEVIDMSEMVADATSRSVKALGGQTNHQRRFAHQQKTLAD